MHTKKFMLYASVVMLVSAISVTGQAADKQENKSKDTNQAKTKPKVEEKLPIVIEADNLSFSDLTGDLFADGNVVFKRDQETILTDHMHGNAKQTEVWMEGQATLQQPGTKLVGTDTHYNYTTRVGDMDMAKGKVGHQYLSGDNITFSPTKLTAYNGTMTKCPAISPDYHMSAERVEIWPGEKMIAYNAKFWIGKTVIYSTSEYETSLVPDEGKSAFPRVGYNSSDGFYISQYLEQPIADRVVAFADVAYTSKHGFVPNYGFISRQNNYTLKLYQGKEENGDNEWIKREPELLLQLKPKRFGKVVGSFTATAGKWAQGSISGSVQAYNVYFSRDPIKLGSKVTLNLGTGFTRKEYGYNQSTNDIWTFNTTVTVKPNDRLDTWIGYYHNDQSGTSPYEYDKIDTSRQIASGFMYKIDKMNSVGVKMEYDVGLQKVDDVDYVWKRNLHCWEADITYRAKRDELNVKISTMTW